jgi:GNAT superfamily N-acetyltransferase
MYRPVQVLDEADRRRFCSVPGPAATTPEALARQRPDSLWLLADGEEVAARCAVWWQNTPPHAGHRLGLVGHYFATTAEAGVEALRLACAELAARACTLAVGPMDGSTWQRYRLITERRDEPVFFLEPDNPDDWPGHFAGAGFTPLAQYYSAVNDDLERADPRVPAVAARWESERVTFRPLDPDRFEDELCRIHALSLESFEGNFLYTRLGEEEFVGQYRGLRPHVVPELVLLAERDGLLVGYLFAVPDLLQARRGQPVDTVIAKTMAVHPGCGGGGLGTLLMARTHEAARRLGYRRVIHALMHQANPSRKISGHGARLIRRYTLFARPLP